MKRLVFLFLFCSAPLFAQNSVFIAPAAAGSNNGTSCANAFAYTYFNTSGNWSATPTGVQIGPGTTVNFCSGTYSTGVLFQGNGSSGNNVVMNCLSGAVFSTAEWSGSGAINTNGHTFETVQNCTVQSTQAGSPTTLGAAAGACIGGACTLPGAYATWTDTRGIYANGCTGCVITGNTVQDLYVHVKNEYSTCGLFQANFAYSLGATVCDSRGYSQQVTTAGTSAASAPSWNDSAQFATTTSGTVTFTNEALAIDALPPDFTNAVCIYAGGDNIVIQNNTAHDCGGGIVIPPQPTAGWHVTVLDNQVYNIDHGVYGGPCGTGCTMPLFSIHDNWIHDHSSWDSGILDLYHHDGIHFWDGTSNGGNQTTELDIYNNVFDGTFGDCCSTARVFLQGDAQTTNIYNNVIMQPNATDTDKIAVSWASRSGTTATVNFYSNTCMYLAPSGNTGTCFGQNSYTNSGSVVNFKDNVLSGWRTFISIPFSTLTLNADYNGYGLQAGSATQAFNILGTFYSSMAAWQAAGFDAHAVTGTGGWTGSLSIETTDQVTSPYIGQLLSGSQAIGAGVNLTSLATGSLAALGLDTSLGNNRTPAVRPTGTTAWDMGAFVFSSAPQVATPTLTPSSGTVPLSVTISTSTTGATICWAVAPTTPAGNGSGGCATGTSLANGGSISVTVAETVNAIGTLSGDTDSAVASGTYTAGFASPTIPPKNLVIAGLKL